MRDAHGALFQFRGRNDTVLSGLRERDFFDRDDAGGGVLFEHLDHARNGAGLRVQAENRIAQGDDEGLVSGEVLTGENGVAQASGSALARVEKFRGPGGFAGAEVEVILDGGFVAAGDEQNLLQTVGFELVDYIFDDGFARDGQHFLGLRTGRGQEPGAEAGYGNYGASY